MSYGVYRVYSDYYIRRKRYLIIAPTLGTTETVSVAGVLTSPSSTLIKQPQTIYSGILSLVGVLNRSASTSMAGTLSSVGALLKQPQKILSGTLSLAGAFKPGIFAAGALTSVGTVTKQVNKIISGALSLTGAINNQGQRVLDSLLSFSGLRAQSDYINKVLSVANANLIAYWPLNETAGTNADNAEGTSARDGTYTGVSLDNADGFDELPVGFWDGANDYVDIETASLNTAFDGEQGSLSGWIRSSAWADATYRTAIYIRVDINNVIEISSSGASILYGGHLAGGTLVQRNKENFTNAGWTHVGLTWDTLGDEVKFYVNGLQEGATLTGLGAWSNGALNGTQTNIGAKAQPQNVWDGYIQHVAIWDTELTSAQMYSLGNPVPSVFKRPNIILSGILSFAGALIKQAQTTYNGVISFSGVHKVGMFASGVLSSAGALIKQPRINLAGVLSFLGLFKPGIFAAGTLTMSGDGSRQPDKQTGGLLAPSSGITKQAQKLLSGVLSVSGALSVIRTRLITLLANLTPSGALQKQPRTIYNGILGLIGNTGKDPASSMQGNINSSGSTFKQPQTNYAGTISFTGLLANIKTRLLAIAGTLTMAGALLKQPQTIYAGVLTTAGSITKQAQTTYNGVLSFTGGGARRAGKVLSGSLSSAGTLIKQPRIILNGVLTLTGALSNLEIPGGFTVAVGGVLSLSGAILKQANKGVAGGSTFSGDLGQQVASTLSGILTSTGAVASSAILTFSGTLVLSGSIIKQAGKVLGAAVNMSGGVGSEAGKAIGGVLSPSGSTLKQVRTAMAGVISFTGTVATLVVTTGAALKSHFRGMFKGMFRKMNQ